MSRDGLPTGEQPEVPNDVADPHPSTEEHYDKIEHPGGVKSHKESDLAVNSYSHDGKAPPRPKNRGADPQ